MGERLEVEYVYAGALLHEDDVVYSYIRVVEGELVKDSAVVYPRVLSKHIPGSVLKFTAIDTPDNLIPATVQFRSIWNNGADVEAWRVMSAAVLESEEAYKDALGKGDGYFKSLDNYAQTYAGLSSRERVVLLAQICAYIANES